MNCIRSRLQSSGRSRHSFWTALALFLPVIWAALQINLAQPAISAPEAERRPKVGLALAGGGTRGCAHIGVIRVLKQEGIPIDCIAGTSIGSIVGGLYASGVSLDQIEALVSNKKLLHAYDTVPIPVRVALIPIFAIPHLFGYHHYDGLYRGNVFANFIRSCAPEEHRNIESFPIRFAAVASNLLDCKAYAIKSGDIGKAVQASSAIPFLRRPVEIDDKLLIDGGIVLNLPVDQARELGADFVIAVDIDDNLKKLDKKDFYKIGSGLDRAMNMHLSAVDSYQLAKADFVIHPDVTGITLLDGDPKSARAAIKAGEEIARKLLPVLKQKYQECCDQRRERTGAKVDFPFDEIQDNLSAGSRNDSSHCRAM